MSNVVDIDSGGRYEVGYIFDEGDKVVGVTHPDWPFRIMRVDDRIALVCEDNDEPFGELDADIFNTILMCWLLVDDPKLIDEAAQN